MILRIGDYHVLPIFFDFDYFVMWSPDDQNIGRVATPFTAIASRLFSFP